LDEIEENTFVLVYFDVKNLLDTLKPKILKVRAFKTAQERNLFCNSLYLDLGNSTPVEHKNKPNLFLGLFISLLLILTPFYPNLPLYFGKVESAVCFGFGVVFFERISHGNFSKVLGFRIIPIRYFF